MTKLAAQQIESIVSVGASGIEVFPAMWGLCGKRSYITSSWGAVVMNALRGRHPIVHCMLWCSGWLWSSRSSSSASRMTLSC